jgi:hypothetical protein
MTKHISQITVLGLLTLALVALPALSRAEGPEAKDGPAASEKTPTGKPGKHGIPFHGKLGAVDAKAMTLTVGTLVIHVSADTKITRNGQSATLADGVVGEPAGGAYQKAADGQLNATVVHFGGKGEMKPEDKPEHKDGPKQKVPLDAGTNKK